MSDDQGCAVELHLKARIEDGRLIENRILCPCCGGDSGKFIGYDGNGTPCVFLACSQCGNHLAEFPTDAEMEKLLEQIWRGVREYLLYPPPVAWKKTAA